jgi:hypothetical protein
MLDGKIEREARRVFMQQFNAAYARLKADPKAWAAYQQEQRELEGTLGDGLPDDDWSDLLTLEPEQIEFVVGDEDGPRGEILTP